MPEGVFPKADDEILYASEVNDLRATRFHWAPAGSFVTSGTSYVTVGSILVDDVLSGCLAGLNATYILNTGSNQRSARVSIGLSGTDVGLYSVSTRVNFNDITTGTEDRQFLPVLNSGLGNTISDNNSTAFSSCGFSINPGLNLLGSQAVILLQLQGTSNSEAQVGSLVLDALVFRTVSYE